MDPMVPALVLFVIMYILLLIFTDRRWMIALAAAALNRQYRARGGAVIATRDTHPENYLNTQEGKYLPVIHCVKGTEGWELDDRIAEALGPDALILDKPTFGSTELAAEHGEENVNTEIVGLCTDICVVSNALLLKAFYHEMPISLDAGCCAGVTPEKHLAALETMASCQIQITNR